NPQQRTSPNIFSSASTHVLVTIVCRFLRCGVSRLPPALRPTNLINRRNSLEKRILYSEVVAIDLVCFGVISWIDFSRVSEYGSTKTHKTTRNLVHASIATGNTSSHSRERGAGDGFFMYGRSQNLKNTQAAARTAGTTNKTVFTIGNRCQEPKRHDCI